MFKRFSVLRLLAYFCLLGVGGSIEAASILATSVPFSTLYIVALPGVFMLGMAMFLVWFDRRDS